MNSKIGSVISFLKPFHTKVFARQLVVITVFCCLVQSCHSNDNVKITDSEFIYFELKSYFNEHSKFGNTPLAQETLDSTGIRKHLEKCWSFEIYKGAQLFYLGDYKALSVYPLVPFFYIKEENVRYFYKPIQTDNFNSETKQKNNLIVLNDMINKLDYFKSLDFRNSEQVEVLKRIFILTFIQIPYYYNVFLERSYPPYYFLNLRNIKEFKLIDKSILENKLLQPNITESAPLSIEDYFHTDSLHAKKYKMMLWDDSLEKVRHYNQILLHQKKMIKFILNYKDYADAMKVSGKEFYFYTIPDYRFFVMKIFKADGQVYIIGSQLNRMYDTDEFYGVKNLHF